MSLTDADVRHVAKLSAIELSDEERGKFKQDLGDILEYVARLSEVATLGVIPTSHVHGAVNAFRDDLSKESLPQDTIARNAPDFVAGSFRVPKVL